MNLEPNLGRGKYEFKKKNSLRRGKLYIYIYIYIYIYGHVRV